MADRTFVCGPVSWKSSGVCVKHGLCRRRGWFFTDETDSFEGGSQKSETHKVRILLQAFLNLPGFTSGEAEEDFSGEEDFEASDSQEGI